VVDAEAAVAGGDEDLSDEWDGHKLIMHGSPVDGTVMSPGWIHLFQYEYHTAQDIADGSNPVQHDTESVNTQSVLVNKNQKYVIVVFGIDERSISQYRSSRCDSINYKLLDSSDMVPGKYNGITFSIPDTANSSDTYYIMSENHCSTMKIKLIVN